MPSILIVDDSSLDRYIAGACVEEAAATPLYAANGLEALEMIEREKPDIVLTDLQMPEMDGLLLVQKIREQHPKTPVILMTAHGSEETAVAALRAGAASYVPKKNLNRNLGDALRTVLAAVDARRGRDQVRNYLHHSESYFIVGYELAGRHALISYLQDGLAQLNFSDEGGLTQVSTALVEALANAIDHGNLELDSVLREREDNSYRELGDQRAKLPPYCDRRVHVKTKLTKEQAVFAIQDEGPGFDISKLPDPTDPENLLKPSGRGVMLIHAFMDEVSYNPSGNEITMKKSRSRVSSD